MTTAVERVERERNRQIDQEGFTAAWDDKQNQGDQLAVAAACYLVQDTDCMVIDVAHVGSAHAVDAWPWGNRDTRACHDRLSRLTIAAALTLAAIDQEIRRLSNTGGRR